VTAEPTPPRIYLTGFMGSGKTTLGRRLAERRGVPFLDLDLAFENLAGTTIRESFETRGEAWFRARESELLKGTADLPGAVVALGGGTFVLPENAAFVKRSGISVFLDVPFEVIASRLGGKALDRPLFRSVEEARSLYEARVPYYRIADRIVSLNGGEALEAAVDRVEAVLPPPTVEGAR
jgi:shikimate kinase